MRGTQISLLSGNLMASGITPMMVDACPFTLKVLPRTAGSALYRVLQTL
jgi:hypothetical protein